MKQIDEGSRIVVLGFLARLIVQTMPPKSALAPEPGHAKRLHDIVRDQMCCCIHWGDLNRNLTLIYGRASFLSFSSL